MIEYQERERNLEEQFLYSISQLILNHFNLLHLADRLSFQI